MKRLAFSQHLTVGQIAEFCGRNVKAFRRIPWLVEYGTRTDIGHREYTFADACNIFYRLCGRRPAPLEFETLCSIALDRGDMSEDDRFLMEALIIKALASGLVEREG